jgi:hypothetical protein
MGAVCEGGCERDKHTAVCGYSLDDCILSMGLASNAYGALRTITASVENHSHWGHYGCGFSKEDRFQSRVDLPKDWWLHDETDTSSRRVLETNKL